LKLVVSRTGFSEEKFDSRERTFTSLGSTQNPITKFVEVNLHEIRFGQTKRVLACFIQIVKELELPGLQEGVQTNADYMDAVDGCQQRIRRSNFSRFGVFRVREFSLILSSKEVQTSIGVESFASRIDAEGGNVFVSSNSGTVAFLHVYVWHLQTGRSRPYEEVLYSGQRVFGGVDSEVPFGPPCWSNLSRSFPGTSLRAVKQ
jgi:hypothetical protein